MMVNFEKDPLSSEFSSLLSNTLTLSGFERLFGIAFVFTVETGFIPTSLAEYFDSTNSNIELAKKINSPSISSFWQQINNIFNGQLVMSNQLCNLTGVPNGDSLIITLSHSNISKCTILESTTSNFDKKSFYELSLRFKNVVSFPIKCAVLDISGDQCPSLCGIPEELILYIMNKLEPYNLYALMRSCKRMKQIAIINQTLWKKIVIEELYKNTTNPLIELDERVTDWRHYYYRLKEQKSGRGRTQIIRDAWL